MKERKVMALVSIGTEEALESINRTGLRNFIISMKQQNGSFSVHKGGETDVRLGWIHLL
jgi:protein farnesyltransferase subunit beta